MRSLAAVDARFRLGWKVKTRQELEFELRKRSHAAEAALPSVASAAGNAAAAKKAALEQMVQAEVAAGEWCTRARHSLFSFASTHSTEVASP